MCGSEVRPESGLLILDVVGFVVILFAKAPLPGRVKTRLSPVLTAEQAAELHDCLVRDSLELLLREFDPSSIELHTDQETAAWKEYGVVRRLQCAGDLGDRMYTALQHALTGGRERAMIVGSDAVGLGGAHLKQLLYADADVALGPTEDGGYYAISCRRIDPRMFEKVRWSTSSALADTKRAAESCGLSVALGLPACDIDEPADLRRLQPGGDAGRHVAEFCRRVLAGVII